MKLILFALVTVQSVWTASAATNLLVNGSFENPGDTFAPTFYKLLSGGDTNITGWTTTLNGAEYVDIGTPGYGNNYNDFFGLAQDGRYVVDLTPGFVSNGGIQQAFVTEVGQRYTVTVYLGTSIGDNRGQPRTGTATIKATVGTVTTNLTVTNMNTFYVWTSKTFDFVADSTNSLLTLECFDNSLTHFSSVDNVSVIRTPTNSTVTVEINPSIIITGVVGQSYVIQYSQSIISPNWIKLGFVTLETPVQRWHDKSASFGAKRFYRAVPLP